MNMHQDSKSVRTQRPSLLRRQYIVDKPFQYRLINRLLLVWFVNSVFFSLILYFLYEWNIKKFYTLTPREDVVPLLSLDALAVTAVVFVSLFGLAVVGIMGAYLSNQIAGPLYRVKGYLERMGRGDFSFEVRFRRGDFLQDVPGIFNNALAGLRTLTESEIEKLDAIGGSLDDDDAVRRLISEIKRQKLGQVGGEEQETEVPVETTPASVH